MLWPSASFPGPSAALRRSGAAVSDVRGCLRFSILYQPAASPSGCLLRWSNVVANLAKAVSVSPPSGPLWLLGSTRPTWKLTANGGTSDGVAEMLGDLRAERCSSGGSVAQSSWVILTMPTSSVITARSAPVSVRRDWWCPSMSSSLMPMVMVLLISPGEKVTVPLEEPTDPRRIKVRLHREQNSRVSVPARFREQERCLPSRGM